MTIPAPTPSIDQIPPEVLDKVHERFARFLEPLPTRAAIVTYVVLVARGSVADSFEELQLWTGYSPGTLRDALTQLEQRQMIERSSRPLHTGHGRRTPIRAMLPVPEPKKVENRKAFDY